MLRIARAGLLLAVASCNGNKPEDRPPIGDDDDPTTPPDCRSDLECVDGREICEGEVCVEGDRDPSFDDATAIGLGDAVAEEGWIFPAGDVDHYVYRAPNPQWISLSTVSNDESELDTVISVYDADGSLHASGDGFPVYPYRVFGTLRGQTVDFDDVVFVYLPTAGEWYVRIEDRATHYGEPTDGRGGRNWRYDLLALEMPGTAEPDGADAPSSTLIVDDEGLISLVGVVIDEPGDVDHIQLDFGFDAHLLEVWGQPLDPGSTANPIVRLYADGEPVAVKDGLGGDAGWLSWFEGRAGTYELQAGDALGLGSRDAWYVVYVRTYRSSDLHPFFGPEDYLPEIAPNDQPAEATPVPPASAGGQLAYRVQGTIEAEGDVDWWRVDAAAGDQIGVRCWTSQFGSLAALRVGLAAGGGVEWASSDGPVADDAWIVDAILPADGPLELAITSTSGGGIGHWYRCTATVAAASLARSGPPGGAP